MELTWEGLVAASSALGALTAFAVLFARGVRWFDRQKSQDAELLALQIKHDEDMTSLKQEHARHLQEVKEEQFLLTYGILACLKGLKEQGCNGPVTAAIAKIEKHLNQKAHM